MYGYQTAQRYSCSLGVSTGDRPLVDASIDRRRRPARSARSGVGGGRDSEGVTSFQAAGASTINGNNSVELPVRTVVTSQGTQDASQGA